MIGTHRHVTIRMGTSEVMFYYYVRGTTYGSLNVISQVSILFLFLL